MGYSKERIDENRKFLKETWNLNNKRPAIKMMAFNPPKSKYTWMEMFYSPAKNLEYKLELLEEMSKVMDDSIPTLDTFLGTGVFPSAFGCEMHYYVDQDPWAKPVIFKNPDDVYKLPTPAVDDGDLRYVIDTTAYFEEKTKGAYPIKIGDPQSPLDIAYLIWKEEELMLSMIDHPEQVHKLMELTTDLFIRFMKKQKSMCTEFTPVHSPNLWAPAELGIGLSDDCCAVLSPKLYEEFALPYVNRISEEFGGIFLHSCGNVTHNLDNLLRIKNLRCLNVWITETPAEAVFEKFSGKTSICLGTGINKDAMTVDSLLDFTEYVLKNKKTSEGLILYGLTATPVPYKVPTTMEMIDRVIELVYNA